MNSISLMSINCPLKIDPLPLCIPECNRWSTINSGQPVKLFHDVNGITDNPYDPSPTIPYQPNFFPVLVGEDPEQMFLEAVNMWEEQYDCGNLFEVVDDPAAANTIIYYVETDGLNGDPSDPASAYIFVDTDETGCTRNFNLSTTYTPESPATQSYIRMTFHTPIPPGTVAQQLASRDSWIGTIVHELGHILGMGHQYNVTDNNVGPFSVMGASGAGGVPGSGLPDGHIHPIDKAMLDARYPCDCNIVDTFPESDIQEDIPLGSSTVCR